MRKREITDEFDGWIPASHRNHQREGSLKAPDYQQSEYELTGKEAELQSRVGKGKKRKDKVD